MRKTLKQIEPVARLNLSHLNDALNLGDSKMIHDLLGDDDLLGVKKIDYQFNPHYALEFVMSVESTIK